MNVIKKLKINIQKMYFGIHMLIITEDYILKITLIIMNRLIPGVLNL